VKKAIVSGILTLLVGALAIPARAATTSTTFALTAGSLSISAPASKNLGSTATGSASISGQLGTTTVTDARGALLGSWTSTVSSGSFTTGGGTANETIPNSDVTYWSGPATASSGVGTFTPGQPTSGNAVALGSSQTAYAASSVVGNNSVSWNPTLTVNIPAAAVVGTYSGTITHSVA
jgi:hypothetical protein